MRWYRTTDELKAQFSGPVEGLVEFVREDPEVPHTRAYKGTCSFTESLSGHLPEAGYFSVAMKRARWIITPKSETVNCCTRNCERVDLRN